MFANCRTWPVHSMRLDEMRLDEINEVKEKTYSINTNQIISLSQTCCKSKVKPKGIQACCIS